MKCKNFQQCKGMANGRDGFCQYCREVEKPADRHAEMRLRQLEQKPIKPNYPRELDLEDK